MSFERKLAELRSLLATTTDFSKPWDFFHDEIVRDPAFMRLGERRPNVALGEILDLGIGRATGRPVRSTDSLFVHLPAHRFWHGTVRVGWGEAICFSFEEDGPRPAMGLCGYAASPSGNDLILLRISPVAVGPGAWVARGPVAKA